MLLGPEWITLLPKAQAARSQAEMVLRAVLKCGRIDSHGIYQGDQFSKPVEAHHWYQANIDFWGSRLRLSNRVVADILLCAGDVQRESRSELIRQGMAIETADVSPARPTAAVQAADAPGAAQASPEPEPPATPPIAQPVAPPPLAVAGASPAPAKSELGAPPTDASPAVRGRDIFNTQRASDYLKSKGKGVEKHTLENWRWIEKKHPELKKGPPHKQNGTRVYYLKADLDAWDPNACDDMRPPAVFSPKK